jgi:hypothetical protein
MLVNSREPSSDPAAGLQSGEWGPIDQRFAPSRTWTSLARPDDAWKTLVDEQGRLLYGFERPSNDEEALFRLGFRQVVSFRLLSGPPMVSWSQRLPHPATPMVETVLSYPHAELQLATLGFKAANGSRTDIVRWRIAAKRDDVDVGLWVQVQGSDDGLRRPVGTVPTTEVTIAAADAGVASTLLFAPQAVSIAPAYDFGPAVGLATDPVTVGRGETVEGTVFLLLGHTDVDELQGRRVEELIEENRRFWAASRFDAAFGAVPEPALAAMVTAAARTIAQAREIRGGVPHYQAGPSVYRGYWVLDGHFLLEAERYLGHHDDARRGLEALTGTIDPSSGVVQVLPGHLKEPAVALATLVRQAELGLGLDELERWWPTIERTVAHLESLVRPSGTSGITPPAIGDGGLGGLREEYTSILWWLTGIRAAIRGAAYLGRPTDRLLAFYEPLRDRTLLLAEQDVAFTEQGLRYWPMLRPGSGTHRFAGDADAAAPWHTVGAATATYALAHAIYPGEVFGPDDQVVAGLLALLATLDQAESVPVGTGWLPHRAVWTYSAPMYGQVALYAGDAPRALRYLEGFVNHAAPTLVWREEQPLKTTGAAHIVGDMPHSWAAAEFIRLLRDLIVFERGDVAEILPGVAAAWFSAGERLRLADTPTRFGPATVDLAYRSERDWRLDVTAPPGRPASLHRCIVRLPSAGTPAVPVFQDDARLPDSIATVDLRAGTRAVFARGIATPRDH